MSDLLRDSILGTMAEALDDIERVRIANENRLRSMTMADMERGGHALTPGHEAVDQMAQIVAGLRAFEDQTTKALEKLMKAHPLGDFVAETPGLGRKQVARLLACIGDPYWHDAEDRPRSVRELWAYCGQHVIDGEAPRRRKGTKINWNADAKMRVHLIAECCVKARTSPYRDTYDYERSWYADAVHEAPCVRCGPSGHPAQIGSDLSDGHKHARAMRKMAKEILKDLWIEAKREHDRVAARMAAA